MPKPHRAPASAVALVVLGVGSFLACNGSGPMPVHPPTVASQIAADKAPLVVDWPAGPRTDLEAATADGVAVVRVEPAKLTLLKDCHLPGSYGFVGVSTKEQLIRLDDAADVSLSLPLRGAGLAADLSGELGSSVALDVALVTVGRRRTTRSFAPRSALKGTECAGATHFVRGFDIGAFVLATSEKQNLSTVASLFGAKGAYAKKSGKAVRESDGALDACKSATPTDKAPPPQCSAPLRLDLKALDEAETVDSATCGSGLVRAAGKCTSTTNVAKNAPYECDPAHEDECKTECDAGDAASCGHFAYSARRSMTKAPDFKSIQAAAEKGCSGGSERACVVLGELHQFGNGTTRDMKRAAELFGRACTAGEAFGCYREGALYDRRPGLPFDGKKAEALYDRACRAGFAEGCNNLGALYLGGRLGKSEPERARGIYEEACKNGSAFACGNLGDLLAEGIGGAKDIARADTLWTQACAGSGAHCVRLGDATSGMGPLAKDPMRSVDAYQKAMKLLSSQCSLGLPDRCDELGWLFHDGRVPRDDEQAYAYVKKACDLGSPMACNDVGVFLENGWGVAPNRTEAKKKFVESCDAENLHACVSVAILEKPGDARTKLLAKACEGGVARGCYVLARDERIAGDSTRARTHVERACQDGYGPACSYFGRWLTRDRGRAEATSRLEIGCQKGDLAGCASLAELVEGDRARALAKRACDGGVARGCRVLAEHSSSEALPLLQKACDGRDLASCVTLAERIASTEPGRAGGLLEKACNTNGYKTADLDRSLGNVTAAANGPELALKGPRDAADERFAAAAGSGVVGERLRLRGGEVGGAAKPGSDDERVASRAVRTRPSRPVRQRSNLHSDPRETARADDHFDAGEGAVDDQYAGCVALGRMYEKGKGESADADRAATLYGAACTYGDGNGCVALAQVESRQKKNQSRILALYDRACDLDAADGCLKAALANETSGKANARESALADFVRACELGSSDGCMRAGDKLTAADPDTALDMFETACKLKVARGCEQQTKLEKRVAAESKPSPLERVGPVPTVDRTKIDGDVVVGTPISSPTISDAARVAAGARGRLRACYVRELQRDPSITGKLSLALKVTKTGEVESASIATNSTNSQSLAQCCTASIKNVKFSSATAQSTVEIPLTFVPK